MAITEIVLFRLKSGITPSTPSFLANLLTSKRAKESLYPNSSTYCYAEMEDPSHVYVFSGWDSIAQHEEWQGKSAARIEDLMPLLSQISVEWMFHVPIDVELVAKLDKPVLAFPGL